MIKGKLIVFHDEELSFLSIDHVFHICIILERGERLCLCDLYIEKILREDEFSSFQLERSNTISFRRIHIESPNVGNPERKNEEYSEDIGLRYREAKLFSDSLSFREDSYMSFFHYENICIHAV